MCFYFLCKEVTHEINPNLTPQLDLLAEIDNYESLLFTRRWHEVGEFELRINRHKRHTELLQRGNLVMLGASRNKVGIIRHREIALDEGGKASETWLVKGIALKGVALQRIVVPSVNDSHDRASGAAETVMKHYVNNHIVNPVDVKRKIDMLALAVDQQRGSQISWESRFKNLADDLIEISKASGLGWDVILDFEQKNGYSMCLKGGISRSIRQRIRLLFLARSLNR